MQPQEELTPESVRLVLGLVSLEVAAGIIAAWTPNERALAYDYAVRQHLHASDNHSIRLRDLPWFIAMSVVASAPGATVIIPDELSHLFQRQGAGK
jgi:hypothetical protein